MVAGCQLHLDFEGLPCFGIASIAQDWGDWLQRGLLDFVTPMNYSNQLSDFNKWTSAQMPLPGAKQKLYPGIGVRAADSHLDATDTITQIDD